MKLCINADDYALDASVSEGILAAAREGIVTSTSAMTVTGRTDDLARLSDVPGLSVGLHVTLTRPARGALAARSPLGLARAVLSGRVSEDDVHAEAERQLADLRAAYPGRVTHVDAHEHVHALPAVRRALQRLVDAHGLSPLRIPRIRPRGSCMKAWILDAAFARVRSPVAFCGLDLMGGRMTDARVRRCIEALVQRGVERAEFMVHVGEARDGGSGHDAYSVHRPGELKVLRDVLPWLQRTVSLVSRDGLR